MQHYYDLATAQLAAVLDMSETDIRKQIVTPPKPAMGDLGFPCFALAKTLKKAPLVIAQEIAALLTADAPFSEIKAVGPFVNFCVSTESLATDVLAAAVTDPDHWGESTTGCGKTVVIDYSSPNIAKPLGVHHIRSTMIGAALARLYAAAGWRVVTVNHLGDWGTNFGQLMVSYKKAEAANPQQPVDIDALLKLYIQFHAAAGTDDSLADEARAWFKKLEDGDGEAVRLWEIFVAESLKSLKKLYARLGVSFDHYTGESFFNDKMDAVVTHLENKKLLVESDGAQVVDLAADGMPPCLIRKSDGATTYGTRDLAAATYRHTEYNFAKCLYVVANQQELHFRQVFRVLDLTGDTWSEGCEHVKFGMLSFGKGVFADEQTTGSTRKGHVIFLADVLDRAVAQARAIIDEKARDDETRASIDTLAETIGVGAVIFTEFLQRRQKDVVFTWDKALNLQGDSGVYLQYTHARLASLRREFEKQHGAWNVAAVDWSKIGSALERQVMLALAQFGDRIAYAVRENEPSIVADYLLELCAVFNRMFTDKENHRAVTDDVVLSIARIGLAEGVRITVARGLELLGLIAPERL